MQDRSPEQKYSEVGLHVWLRKRAMTGLLAGTRRSIGIEAEIRSVRSPDDECSDAHDRYSGQQTFESPTQDSNSTYLVKALKLSLMATISVFVALVIVWGYVQFIKTYPEREHESTSRIACAVLELPFANLGTAGMLTSLRCSRFAVSSDDRSVLEGTQP